MRVAAPTMDANVLEQIAAICKGMERIDEQLAGATVYPAGQVDVKDGDGVLYGHVVNVDDFWYFRPLGGD